MSFERVNYKDLNSRQKELFNFQKVAATLADYGFNCIKLTDDWQGADFLACHIDGTTLRVQLKSRATIQKKYRDKDIWIAFPHGGFWYLVPHDSLVEMVDDNTDWLKSSSWVVKEGYSSISLNRALQACLAKYKLGPVYGTILEENGDVD